MDRHKIFDLLNYLACLSEDDPAVPWTKERIKEINKVAHEIAHEIRKVKE